jgi:hypothetical protein
MDQGFRSHGAGKPRRLTLAGEDRAALLMEHGAWVGISPVCPSAPSGRYEEMSM